MGNGMGSGCGVHLYSAVVNNEGATMKRVVKSPDVFSINFPGIVSEFGELKADRKAREAREVQIIKREISKGYIYSFGGLRAPRQSCCWGCKTRLDNALHKECDKCDWIICPGCGACGPACSVGMVRMRGINDEWANRVLNELGLRV